MSETKTRVVKVNGKSPDLWQADSNHRYVGRMIVLRSGRYQGQIWGNSGFGNPYVFREEDNRIDRQKKLLMYCYRLGMILHRNGMVREEFQAMHGKSLGCWCVDWNFDTIETPLCHACYLAQLVDQFHWNIDGRRELKVIVRMDGSIGISRSATDEGVLIVQTGKLFSVKSQGDLGIDFSLIS